MQEIKQLPAPEEEVEVHSLDLLLKLLLDQNPGKLLEEEAKLRASKGGKSNLLASHQEEEEEDTALLLTDMPRNLLKKNQKKPTNQKATSLVLLAMKSNPMLLRVP
jgi:hypothetical protein